MPALTQEQKITVGYLFHVYKVPPQAMATLMGATVESLHKLIRSWGGSVPAAARKMETPKATAAAPKLTQADVEKRAKLSKAAKKRWAKMRKSAKKNAGAPSKKAAARRAKITTRSEPAPLPLVSEAS